MVARPPICLILLRSAARSLKRSVRLGPLLGVGGTATPETATELMAGLASCTVKYDASKVLQSTTSEKVRANSPESRVKPKLVSTGAQWCRGCTPRS